MKKRGQLGVRRIEKLLDEIEKGETFLSKTIGDMYHEKYGSKFMPNQRQVGLFLRRIPTCQVWSQSGRNGAITWVKV